MQPHRRQPSRLSRPWDSPGKNTGVGCHFLLQCMKVKSESEVAQSCPTLSMDCSLPGSSIHGIFQARVLEWGAISFSDWLAQVLGKSWQLLCWQFSSVQFSCCDPMDCSLPGSSIHGISRQEYWSGLPLPSPNNKPLLLLLSCFSRVQLCATP